MIRSLMNWVEQRTGAQKLLHEALYENIPSGARWRYITGSMLVFAFVTQAITGVFLWMAYSPSSQTAYESVYYIQHEMSGGWLVRGVHHFMAQAMVVVMGLHLLQVIVDGAYKAPREVNYWLGLVLMQLVLGLGLTGYLLPWDQKGFWATNVATNLMTLVPFVGKELQQLAVGGSSYGNHTLTRFFAMHAGVLPALLIGFLALHIAAFRKHGITAKITAGRPDQYFWPHQVLLDAIGCLVLLGIVLLCVIHFDVNGLMAGKLSTEHLGAELGAPADPSEAYSAARPEWYYLFLFQLLKYFHGTQEVIGALIIPGIAMTLLGLVPILGRSKLGHAFNVTLILALLGAAGTLTILAIQEDAKNPEHQVAVQDAALNAERTHELINRRETLADGTLSDRRLIQKHGAVYLLRNDPLIQGPKLFGAKCASCHDYRNPHDSSDKLATSFVTKQSPVVDAEGKPVTGEDGKPGQPVKRDAAGNVLYGDPQAEIQGAPNLFGFGSREWIKGLLNKERFIGVTLGKAAEPKSEALKETQEANKRPIYADYFGLTNHREGRMAQWVAAHGELLKDDPAKEDDDVDAIAAALSAQAQLRSQHQADSKDAELIRKGIGLINQNCARGCHRLGSVGELGLAPDLTGYGSYAWMMGFISDPTHSRFYRQENDRMPSFAADLAKPAGHTVSIRELSLIVDWLRGDYYLPNDLAPVLPHSEEYARQTVQLARTSAEPFAEVIGAAAPLPETKLARAERLFTANCSNCHNHTDELGRGLVAKNPSAPNLFGFASRTWLTGLLTPAKISGEQYFGQTEHAEGDMVNFVRDNLTTLDDAGKKRMATIIVALSAEAGLPAQVEADKAALADGSLEAGKKSLSENFAQANCLDCHIYRVASEGIQSAPDLTGYGSREWLVRFITNPGDSACYGKSNDRMPAFGTAGKGTIKALLSKEDVELLARYLRGEALDVAAP